MNQLVLILFGCAVFSISLRAKTNIYSVSPNVAIVDDSYNGSLNSMSVANLNISTNVIIQNISADVAITHTWIGDLVIKLRSPAGTVVTLMSRPGFIEAADDGSGGPGSSANISSTFPIHFSTGAATSAENMGSTLSNSGVVCQTDGICDYAPNAGAASTGSLTSFIGQSAAGIWKLCVGDAGLGDTGTLNTFALRIITSDPEAPPDRPQMTIARSGTNVIASWSTNATGFTLEANQPLTSNGWAIVSAPQVVSGTNYTVTLPATNTARYFRLRFP